MSSNKPLQHALHNDELCRELIETKFRDWVVTTAFYAAVHFVEHAVFPIKDPESGEEVPGFNRYCEGRSGGKHRLRSELVQRHLITVAGEYNWLKHTSWSARYNDYQVSDKVRDRAVASLDSIKSVCT